MDQGVSRLIARDPALRSVVERHGEPPAWARDPGFETLVRIVLEQQVSLVSGRAIYERLRREIGPVTADGLIAVGEEGLRALGVTRQKSSYLVGLAERVANQSFDLDGLEHLDTPSARRELVRIRGIGPWTADVYLLMALRHDDVWPRGDIALHTAMQRLLGLASRPDAREAEAIAERWAPWRSAAARILWHGYIEGSLGRATTPAHSIRRFRPR